MEWEEWVGIFWGKCILSKVICMEMSVLFCSSAFGGVVGKFQCEWFCPKNNTFPRQGLLQICHAGKPQHMLVKPWWCSSAELSDDPVGDGEVFHLLNFLHEILCHILVFCHCFFFFLAWFFFLFTGLNKKWITSPPFIDSFNFTLRTFYFFSVLDASAISVLCWRVSDVMGQIKWPL